MTILQSERSTLEQCARAICIARNSDPDFICHDQGGDSYFLWEDFKIAAKACLQALMDVDDKTIEAMWMSQGDTLNNRPVWKRSVDVQMNHAFQAAIQSILGESK